MELIWDFLCHLVYIIRAMLYFSICHKTFINLFTCHVNLLTVSGVVTWVPRHGSSVLQGKFLWTIVFGEIIVMIILGECLSLGKICVREEVVTVPDTASYIRG
jgi:hypothetical protein